MKYTKLLFILFIFNSFYGVVLNKIKIIGNEYTKSSTTLEIASDLKEGDGMIKEVD
ncbi:MAG: hypothetical protein ACP5QT_08320 [Brevinematia bacterium]